MAHEARNTFGAPIFEPTVFWDQIYCTEESTFDIVESFWYPAGIPRPGHCAFASRHAPACSTQLVQYPVPQQASLNPIFTWSRKDCLYFIKWHWLKDFCYCWVHINGRAVVGMLNVAGVVFSISKLIVSTVNFSVTWTRQLEQYKYWHHFTASSRMVYSWSTFAFANRLIKLHGDSRCHVAYVAADQCKPQKAFSFCKRWIF